MNEGKEVVKDRGRKIIIDLSKIAIDTMREYGKEKYFSENVPAELSQIKVAIKVIEKYILEE